MTVSHSYPKTLYSIASGQRKICIWLMWCQMAYHFFCIEEVWCCRLFWSLHCQFHHTNQEVSSNALACTRAVHLWHRRHTWIQVPKNITLWLLLIVDWIRISMFRIGKLRNASECELLPFNCLLEEFYFFHWHYKCRSQRKQCWPQHSL